MWSGKQAMCNSDDGSRTTGDDEGGVPERRVRGVIPARCLPIALTVLDQHIGDA
jgi:hypothetical protein